MLHENGKQRLFSVRLVAWTDAWEECVSLVKENLSLADAAHEAAKWMKAKATPWTFEGFGLSLPRAGRIVAVSVEVEEQNASKEGGASNG